VSGDTQRLPDGWHRAAVGGLWETMGALQLGFLVSEGLTPQDRLLDVGCGSLRGGLHFVGHLDPGNYAGIDIDGRLIEAGREELRQAGLADRRATLRVTDRFDVDGLGEFQFALAQSVFTHLPFNVITRCLSCVEEVLVDGGRFYATFFANLDRRLRREELRVGDLDISLDRDPFFYDPDIFRWVCEGSSLTADYLGDWGHPRGQHMMRFTRRLS
jgi:cyclopropane fatty-acyl-phospholipid synthase-like methyltransferase